MKILKQKATSLIKFTSTVAMAVMLSLSNTTQQVEASSTTNSKAQSVVKTASKYTGTKYVYGGTNLNKGVDCSGYVREVYKKEGVPLPRTSKSMAKEGKTVKKNSLKKGDLVFFDTVGKNNKNITHVGVYAGNDKFYHASSGKKKVVKSSLNNSYFKKTYVTSKRVI